MPVETGFKSQDGDGGRPPSTPMEAFKARLAKFETEEGRLRGLSFQPKAGDVMVRLVLAHACRKWSSRSGSSQSGRGV
jgi:hypothetical protein